MKFSFWLLIILLLVVLSFITFFPFSVVTFPLEVEFFDEVNIVPSWFCGSLTGLSTLNDEFQVSLPLVDSDLRSLYSLYASYVVSCDYPSGVVVVSNPLVGEKLVSNSLLVSSSSSKFVLIVPYGVCEYVDSLGVVRGCPRVVNNVEVCVGRGLIEEDFDLNDIRGYNSLWLFFRDDVGMSFDDYKSLVGRYKRDGSVLARDKYDKYFGSDESVVGVDEIDSSSLNNLSFVEKIKLFFKEWCLWLKQMF